MSISLEGLRCQEPRGLGFRADVPKALPVAQTTDLCKELYIETKYKEP